MESNLFSAPYHHRLLQGRHRSTIRLTNLADQFSAHPMAAKASSSTALGTKCRCDGERLPSIHRARPAVPGVATPCRVWGVVSRPPGPPRGPASVSGAGRPSAGGRGPPWALSCNPAAAGDPRCDNKHARIFTDVKQILASVLRLGCRPCLGCLRAVFGKREQTVSNSTKHRAFV